VSRGSSVLDLSGRDPGSFSVAAHAEMTEADLKELRHLRGACKIVIFLDQFCLRPPVYAAGGASKKMFEPCNIRSWEREVR